MKTFLIWCHERQGYWMPNRNGYTIYKEYAGRYDLFEACEICKEANGDLRLPQESVVPVEE